MCNNSINQDIQKIKAKWEQMHDDIIYSNVEIENIYDYLEKNWETHVLNNENILYIKQIRLRGY